MIKVELSYVIAVSYNQFLFEMVLTRKPSHCLAHFGRVAAPAEGTAGVLGVQGRGLGTQPAGQADRTIALPYTCLQKGNPDW